MNFLTCNPTISMSHCGVLIAMSVGKIDVGREDHTIASPNPICPILPSMTPSGNGLPRPPWLTGSASMYFFRSRSRYSKTRYSLWPSACTMLSKRTMLGSFISLSREISRMAVDGTPSSSASRRIFLRATMRWSGVVRSRAL